MNCHLCTAQRPVPTAGQVMHCGRWLLYTGTHVLHRIGSKYSATCRKQAFTLHRSKAKTTPGFNSDRKIRPYAHGLLLESPFGPSIADCWAVRAKNKAKTAVLVAVAAKPEVEIWRRSKKSTFWPWFPIHSFRHFFARTYRFATIQNVTDRRQTTDDMLYQRLDR